MEWKREWKTSRRSEWLVHCHICNSIPSEFRECIITGGETFYHTQKQNAPAWNGNA
jgi:rRNA maturation endonuclease Nob1